ETKQAALALLEALFRSRVGYMWTTGIAREGLVSRAELQGLLAKIEKKLADNREAALRGGADAEIVVVARDLGLAPEPAGTGEHHGQARCPETNHFLLVQSASNAFGCGYCRRKGDPAQLREFARERREWRQSGSGRAPQ